MKKSERDLYRKKQLTVNFGMELLCDKYWNINVFVLDRFFNRKRGKSVIFSMKFNRISYTYT